MANQKVISVTYTLIPGADGIQRSADPFGLVGDQITSEDLKLPEIRELISAASQLIRHSDTPLMEARSLLKELVATRQQKLQQSDLKLPEKWKPVEGLFKLALEKSIPIYITYKLFEVVIQGDLNLESNVTVNQITNNYETTVIERNSNELKKIAEDIRKLLEEQRLAEQEQPDR